jgi:nucleotide-binding universal stress UspA family protein
MSTIIIGADGSARTEDAIAFARRLAATTGAELSLVGAYPYDEWPSRAASHEYGAFLRAETDDMLERMRRLAGDAAATHAVADTSPARALQRAAESAGATLIVVGSTHRGRAGRVMPGTTADRLLHGAPCAVAVVPYDFRLQDDAAIGTVGVGYDGSAESRAAIDVAVEVARRLGASLKVIRVFDASQFGAPALLGGPSYVAVAPELERDAREDLGRLCGGLPEDVDVEAVFLIGNPARELAGQSSQLDLLVLGSRGYGPLRAVLLGGVSHVVVRNAACPVVVLPRAAGVEVGELFAPAAEATV